MYKGYYLLIGFLWTVLIDATQYFSGLQYSTEELLKSSKVKVSCPFYYVHRYLGHCSLQIWEGVSPGWHF